MGVVNRLCMHIVHNLVEILPPLIALHPPLVWGVDDVKRYKLYSVIIVATGTLHL